MGLLQECVTVVAGLNRVVVTGARCEFDVSETSLDVETEAYSVESGWLDSFVILVVLERSRRHHRSLDFLLPKSELLGFAL